MQLVYEFGAKELEPVVDVIQRALGNTQYLVQCIPNDSDTSSPTEDSFSSVALKLKEGKLASFSLHPSNGLIRYALITCPFFWGQQRSAYMGTIEYLGDDYKPLWNLILGVLGLSFACLGFEEGVEVDESALSAETFPWSQWPLVIGAIRDRSGLQPWVIREGPEIKWFVKQS
ncbi:MAG: hypothetical protein HYR55_14435 [Acidobacteria bacterium]|nr:hypothetical protein [Acidobacteriota bacterium]MBI3656914.1 hypothetical protein [Acidobacteriota bacterium]